MSFEDNIKELEAIIKKIEDNKTGVDKTTELFNKATQLIKENYKVINASKGKIVEVKKELDKVIETNFSDK